MSDGLSKTGRIIVVMLAVMCCLCLIAAVLLAAERSYWREREEPAGGSPLGMVLIDVDSERAAASYHVEQLGVYVLAVDENSQAYHAGVRSGDRIVSLNGARIFSTSEWEAAQRHFHPTTTVRVGFCTPAQERFFMTNLLWNGGRTVNGR